MKKVASPSMTARATLGALFFVTGIFLIVFGLSTARLHSATPNSGTLNSTGPQLNWAGTAVGGGSTDESTCVEGVNCDTFVLTLSGTPTNWTGLKARITISADDPSGLTDYDLYVHKGDNSGPIVPGGTSAHGGTPLESLTSTQAIRTSAPGRFRCTSSISAPLRDFNIPAAPLPYQRRQAPP